MSRPWTPQAVFCLRTWYCEECLTVQEIAERFGRTVGAIKNACVNFGLKRPPSYYRQPGAAGRFASGMKPWNSGMPYDAGGRSRDTRFRAGQRVGRSAELWKPIGHERMADGYLQRKVTDTGYTPRDYVSVHRLIWEEAHGPIPAGHALVFRNGDRLDIRLDNLELITRAELMRRNTVHRYPPEVVKTVRARAVLNRAINRITRGAAA